MPWFTCMMRITMGATVALQLGCCPVIKTLTACNVSQVPTDNCCAMLCNAVHPLPCVANPQG